MGLSSSEKKEVNKMIQKKLCCGIIPTYTADEADALNLGSSTRLIWVSDTNGTFTNTGLWYWNGTAWEDADQTGLSSNIYTDDGTIPNATTRIVSFGDATSELRFDNLGSAAIHITGKLTVDGAIDPTWMQFSGNQIDASVPNESIYTTDGSSSSIAAGTIVYKDSSGAYWNLQEVPIEGGGSPTQNGIPSFSGNGNSVNNNPNFQYVDPDVFIYDDQNDGNPCIHLGATGGAEELSICAIFDSGAQTLDYVHYSTAAVSVAANKGLHRFGVDGTDILDINDTGISFIGGSPLMVMGDGTASPEIRLDKDETGFSRIEFYKDGSPSSSITENDTEFLVIDSGGTTTQFNIAGGTRFQVTNDYLGTSASGGGRLRYNGTSLILPWAYPSNDLNCGLGADGSDNISIISGSTAALVAADAGATNNIELFGSSGLYGATTAGQGVLRFNPVTQAPAGTMTDGMLIWNDGTALNVMDSAGTISNLLDGGWALTGTSNVTTPLIVGDPTFRGNLSMQDGTFDFINANIGTNQFAALTNGLYNFAFGNNNLGAITFSGRNVAFGDNLFDSLTGNNNRNVAFGTNHFPLTTAANDTLVWGINNATLGNVNVDQSLVGGSTNLTDVTTLQQSATIGQFNADNLTSVSQCLFVGGSNAQAATGSMASSVFIGGQNFDAGTGTATASMVVGSGNLGSISGAGDINQTLIVGSSNVLSTATTQSCIVGASNIDNMTNGVDYVLAVGGDICEANNSTNFRYNAFVGWNLARAATSNMEGCTLIGFDLYNDATTITRSQNFGYLNASAATSVTYSVFFGSENLDTGVATVQDSFVGGQRNARVATTLNNTFIWGDSNADASTGDLSSSIIIGTANGTAETGNLNNTILLGNQQGNTAANPASAPNRLSIGMNTDQSLIYGEFDNDNVEFGDCVASWGATTPAVGAIRLNDIGTEPQGTLTSGGLFYVSNEDAVFYSDAGDKYNLANPKHVLQIEAFDGSQAVTTGDGSIAVTIPSFMNGYDLVNVVASVEDKGVTGTTDVVVRRWRAGVAADMLSTAITIGDEWFAQDGTIDTLNDDVQTGDRIYVDVDAIHSGTAPNGLSVALEFEKII